MTTPIGFNYQSTNSGILNYVCDFNNDAIVIFDVDWNYVGDVYFRSPRYIEPTSDAIYIGSTDTFCKYDINFNLIQCLNVGNVDDLYYDADDDVIIITRSNSIRAYRPYMTQAYDIPISDFPWGIEKYNGKLYVSTDSNKILIIDLANNNAITSINNVCPASSTVTSISFDHQGYMAIACLYENKLYLFNDQGVSQNMFINTSAQPFTFKFDSKCRFIVTSRASQGSSGVDVFY